jgi:hypothetical protein
MLKTRSRSPSPPLSAGRREVRRVHLRRGPVLLPEPHRANEVWVQAQALTSGGASTGYALRRLASLGPAAAAARHPSPIRRRDAKLSAYACTLSVTRVGRRADAIRETLNAVEERLSRGPYSDRWMAAQGCVVWCAATPKATDRTDSAASRAAPDPGQCVCWARRGRRGSGPVASRQATRCAA